MLFEETLYFKNKLIQENWVAFVTEEVRLDSHNAPLWPMNL